MGIEFSWSDEPAPPTPPPPPKRSGRWIGVTLLTIIGLGALGWFLLQWWNAPSPAAAEQMIGEMLTAERAAFAAGNGPVFFATLPDDPAWQAAQLWPESLSMYAAGRTLVSLEQQGDHVAARLGWESEAGPMTRGAFYTWQAGTLQPAADAPWFWGGMRHQSTEWGALVYAEADAVWASEMESYIGAALERLCAAACLYEGEPLTVSIATTYATTAAPKQIVIPSPHLIAVDGAQEPGPAFWQMLEARLADALTPATIRFAVPAAEASNYAAAAARFQAENPAITVVIVPVEEMATLDLATIDGALLVPSASQIGAGQVVDLTAFAETDPAFDAADFHPRLLAGVTWQGRRWAAPIGGWWSLYYSDVRAHELAGLAPGPPSGWSGMEGQIARLANAAGNERLRMPFADFTGDSLLSLAGAVHCAEDDAQCHGRLSPEAVRSALSWHAGVMAAQPGSPDLRQFTTAERRNFALNNLSRPREIGAWIETPAYFEHNLQIAPLTLMPLPAGPTVRSTPIHVLGGMISSNSQRPRAVWQWLDFLTRERPINEPRTLPGRRAVAEQIGFWEQLPAEVRTPMGEAFEYGRVVRIDEHEIFRPAIIAELLSGSASAADLADEALEIEWFGKTRE
jgi:ABC-type glycerol-3-phosphate transport system substrate-binding protein